MASYLTSTDVANRLRRTYASAYTRDGAIDTDLVAQDIESAEGIVDGYLATRYATPVADAAALRIVKAWALALVEELAYTAIGSGELPAGLKDRVSQVYAQLRAVQDGSLSLGATPAPTEQTAAADYILVAAEDPIMGADNLEGL